MTNREVRQYLLLTVVCVACGVGVWALLRATAPGRQANQPSEVAKTPELTNADSDLWSRSMEKVKEDRGGIGNVALEIPPQLRHYEDRRWFLAAQVAEVRKFNVVPVQDFVDLAAAITRGEIVSVPAVTDDYILFGVGAKVDGGVFTRHVANQDIELNDEAGLRDANARLDTARANLQKEISSLQKQLAALKKVDRAKQDELHNEITAREQELKSNDDGRALLNQSFGSSNGTLESRSGLLKDYEKLQLLARNFRGRSFNLEDSLDRQTLKVYLLSSLRPQALKILEQIARGYHDKFGRPLPVSSLVRPEQYQRVLRRSNRYAVLIDTPPHSTGLAFDIDYRYLSGAEQNFVMSELARLKDEGRIEVLRERGANYHVFAFIDGHRPGDDLISASLGEVGGPVKKTNPVSTPAKKTPAKKSPPKVKNKPRIAKKRR
jgi:hypothetical protein